MCHAQIGTQHRQILHQNAIELYPEVIKKFEPKSLERFMTSLIQAYWILKLQIMDSKRILMKTVFFIYLCPKNRKMGLNKLTNLNNSEDSIMKRWF